VGWGSFTDGGLVEFYFYLLRFPLSFEDGVGLACMVGVAAVHCLSVIASAYAFEPRIWCVRLFSAGTTVSLCFHGPYGTLDSHRGFNPKWT